jgi:carboxypeptidase C (cathepsin A)
VEAPYPWTEVTNMLILDIPLGSGWSYANSEDGVSNSSAWTAGEVDDVLQVCSSTFNRRRDHWPSLRDSCS